VNTVDVNWNWKLDSNFEFTPTFVKHGGADQKLGRLTDELQNSWYKNFLLRPGSQKLLRTQNSDCGRVTCWTYGR
jgi:hypothetical protein